ncbi:MAG: ankyrin repeat domain-containing protein, partial [Pseudomonadota bacterium]
QTFEQIVRARDEDLLKAVLQEGVRPGRYDLLRAAALFELANVFEELFESLPEDDQRFLTNDGQSLLRQAALGGSFEVARFLVDSGADVNRDFPLLAASQEGRWAVVNLLLEAGASLPPESETELLGNAARYGDVPVLQFLLGIGLNENALNIRGEHVLHYPAHHEIEAQGARNWRFLVSRGADPELALCRLDKSTIDHMLEKAPLWYAEVVASVAVDCPALAIGSDE